MTDRKAQTRKRRRWSKPLFRSPIFKVLLSVFLFSCIVVSGTVLYFYVHYSRIIDRKLSGEVFKETARIYAVPYRVYSGQKLTPEAVIARLQRAGLESTEKGGAPDGAYDVNGNRITIRPASGDSLRLDFQKGSLSQIVKLAPTAEQTKEAWLPPELVTNLFDESRQKRRLVEYREIPKFLIDALIASEDQRFYSHHGLDPVRIVGAFVANVRETNRLQGGSTITQQLARNFFLTTDRSLKRKIPEAFIALLLEQRLTKEQILTMYANEIYLGQRGSFSIHGFGEGAAAYFGEDIEQLTLPEAAMLVGVIPAPNAFSPSKYLDRAKTRRNLVLTSMHSLGMITDDQFEAAKNAEIKVAPLKLDASDAPYLVDFIRDELLKDYSEDVLINDSLRVYTTLDPALQTAAVDAVEKGLKYTLDQIAQRNKGKKDVEEMPDPQAALIALDPHTGDIKAMVGGSNYGASQYNRITQAFRQPGSIFKPFVYAAAFETAFDPDKSPFADTTSSESPKIEIPAVAEAAAAAPNPRTAPDSPSAVITPISTFVDEPTTFEYAGMPKPYEPNNYKQQYRGVVTVRDALQHSLNVPTIKVAERIGYERVAQFARRAGLNAKIKGYPSVALGAFEVTPIEMAGAYTIFANEGKRIEPHALVRVSSPNGRINKTYLYEPTEVIRPELAYLMTHLMEGVIDSGTGAGVRARGFKLPAAGKTGTSRDGWFAGYTKDLLVIAWVGYDDNRDLNLEGARSALPIWTEFMIKAAQLYPPQDPDAMYFEPPSGVESARIDPESMMLAGPACPGSVEEVFIAGTAPRSYCPLHGFHISEAIENAVENGVQTGVEAGAEAVETVGTGVKETGSAVGHAVRGIGRFFGGLFGGERKQKDKSQTGNP
jgi:penicillin-binding protein 1B